MTKDQMDEIGRKHGIHPVYRREFLKLASGILDNNRFGERLRSRKYQRVCKDVMHLLSTEGKQCQLTS